MSVRRRWFACFAAALMGLLLTSGAVCADEEKTPEAPKEPEATKEIVRQPMMWVVEGDTKVYLVGTIHISEPRVHALLPEVEKALELSDAVYTELAFDAESMGRLQMAFMTMGILPEGQTLVGVLGEDLHARAAKYMPAMAPITFFANRKPWVIWFLLLQAQMQASLEKIKEAREAEAAKAKPTTGESGTSTDPEGGGDTGGTTEPEPEPAAPTPEKPLDWVLFERAEKAGKTVGGLETPQQQFKIFDELSIEDQVEMVRASVEALEDLKGEKKKDDEEEGEDEDEGEGEGETEAEDDDGDEGAVGREAVEQLTAMVNMWLAGDAEALSEMIKKELMGDAKAEAFAKAMFDTRNEGMVEKICSMMKAEPAKTYFIAVGSGHMPGTNGIVEMLEKRGYKVRKVKTGDEIEASKKQEPAKEPAGAGSGDGG